MIPAGEWTTAAIGLGGNVGDVAAAFRRALDNLDADPDVRVGAVSSLWITAPWGDVDQPDFLNAVARIEARCGPLALLELLQRQEALAGRERKVAWGPRTLDLDLLWFGSEVRRDAFLELPHPRLVERSFVLAPALEVEPQWIHPATGRTLESLRATLVASGGWTRCVKADEAVAPCRN